MTSFLITVCIVLIIGIILGLIGWMYISHVNAQKPEATRKWTDPKIRE